MKIKNRGNIYVVLREMEGSRAAVLGTFADLVEADNHKDEWASAWFDRTGGAPAEFSVVISTHYE